MSRAPPFPTSNRSGQRTNGTPYNYTQPLALNRQPYAPNGPDTRAGNSGTDLPARPIRSDLRQRDPADSYAIPSSMRPGGPSEARRTNRDSVGSTPSESSARRGPRAQIEMPPSRRVTGDGDVLPSPGAERALDSAIRVFQGAAATGTRRRATENAGFGEVDYELQEAEQRKKERDRADRERRERMREREAQQSRSKRRKGAGDIDGESHSYSWRVTISRAHTVTAVLDEIQGEWEWVTKPDV